MRHCPSRRRPLAEIGKRPIVDHDQHDFVTGRARTTDANLGIERCDLDASQQGSVQRDQMRRRQPDHQGQRQRTDLEVAQTLCAHDARTVKSRAHENVRQALDPPGHRGRGRTALQHVGPVTRQAQHLGRAVRATGDCDDTADDRHRRSLGRCLDHPVGSPNRRDRGLGLDLERALRRGPGHQRTQHAGEQPKRDFRARSLARVDGKLDATVFTDRNDRSVVQRDFHLAGHGHDRVPAMDGGIDGQRLLPRGGVEEHRAADRQHRSDDLVGRERRHGPRGQHQPARERNRSPKTSCHQASSLCRTPPRCSESPRGTAW